MVNNAQWKQKARFDPKVLGATQRSYYFFLCSKIKIFWREEQAIILKIRMHVKMQFWYSHRTKT